MFDFAKFLRQYRASDPGPKWWKTGGILLPEFPAGSVWEERQRDWNRSGRTVGEWLPGGYTRSWSQKRLGPDGTPAGWELVLEKNRAGSTREYYRPTASRVLLESEDNPVLTDAVRRRFDDPDGEPGFVWALRRATGEMLVRRLHQQFYDADGELVRETSGTTNGLSVVQGPVAVDDAFDYREWTGVDTDPVPSWRDWQTTLGRPGPLWLCTRQSYWSPEEADAIDPSRYKHREDYDYLLAGESPDAGQGFGLVGWRTLYRPPEGGTLEVLRTTVYTELRGLS